MRNLLNIQPELLAALFVATATVSAAIVNARAQVKVAREARRSAKPVPPPSRRALRWLLLGFVLTVGLGWSAAIGTGTERRFGFMGAGVAAVLGPSTQSSAAPLDSLAVAVLRLRGPMTDREVVALLQRHDLRLYAIDLPFTDHPQAWRPIPISVAPGTALPRARAEVVAHAQYEACMLAAAANALDSAAVTASGVDTTVARALRERVERARTEVQRLASEPAIIHGVRVLGTTSAAARALQDSAVANASISRYESGWEAWESVPPASTACAGFPATAPRQDSPAELVTEAAGS